LISIKDIEAAATKIGAKLKATPLVQSPEGHLLKLENMHRTGSFKERGALYKLLRLKESGKVKSVVAASAGNHAQAVSYHGKSLGFDVTIVMPEMSPLTKVTATESYGAHVQLVGDSFDAAMEHARSLVDDKSVLIHAFDDEVVIAGQGTLGLEILEQQPDVSLVVIPVGGGGLASGTAIALKGKKPNCKIIGVQTECYPFSYAEFKGTKTPAKKPEAAPSTLGDGISVKKVGQVTQPLLKKYLDDMVTVSEEEMAHAILHLLEGSKTLAEGAGAASVAALMSEKIKHDPEKTVAVVSGGNIDVNMIARIIERGLVETHRLVRLNVVVSDRPGGLNKLTALLAELKANILQIHHERATTHIELYTTGTELTLETRGEEHIHQILQTLKKAGFPVTVLD
jgi:threonine dehydratase